MEGAAETPSKDLASSSVARERLPNGMLLGQSSELVVCVCVCVFVCFCFFLCFGVGGVGGWGELSFCHVRS